VEYLVLVHIQKPDDLPAPDVVEYSVLIHIQKPDDISVPTWYRNFAAAVGLEIIILNASLLLSTARPFKVSQDYRTLWFAQGKWEGTYLHS